MLPILVLIGGRTLHSKNLLLDRGIKEIVSILLSQQLQDKPDQIYVFH